MSRCRKMILFVLGALLVAQPGTLWACSACYGAPDSPMSKGLVWGIGVLLGVVGMVLSGIAGFFVYIGKKSAATHSANTERLTENEKVER